MLISEQIETFSIGVDIGGTWLRVGAVGPDGATWGVRKSTLEECKGSPEELIAIMSRMSCEITSGFQKSTARNKPICTPLAAGVAVPGIIDEANGSVVRCLNVPFLNGAGIQEMVAARWGIPVVLTTDAQACAFAEQRTSAAGSKCFIHLRLGTGVACSVIRNGRPELPTREGNRHPTVLIVEEAPEARECRCGMFGCLETVASGRVFNEGGNNLSSDAIHRAVAAIEKAIDNLSVLYDPDVVCLGGGLLNHHTTLRSEIDQRLGVRFVDGPKPSSIVWARLGDDAGVVGAALLAGSALELSSKY